MYNSRRGFPRRMNSVSLQRNGATQYLRPINTVNVPPYMITNEQIDEAVRVIASNHGNAVIDNSFRSRRTPIYLDIGSVKPINRNVMPTSRNRRYNRSQNNVNLIQVEYDPSDPSYVTTSIPYSRNNIIGIHEISNTTYLNNGYRQALDLSIISNNTWYGDLLVRDEETGNVHYENTAWKTSLHYIITTAEASYDSNTQAAMKFSTYIDNDNEPEYIKFSNEGTTDILIMQLHINDKNPATIPNFHEGDVVPTDTPLPYNISEDACIILQPGENIFSEVGFDMISERVQVDEYSSGKNNLSTSVCTIGIEKEESGYKITSFDHDSLGFNPPLDPLNPNPDVDTNYKISYAYARLDQNSNSF